LGWMDTFGVRKKRFESAIRSPHEDKHSKPTLTLWRIAL